MKISYNILPCHITGTVFNNANQHINVYGDDIEVDYRGYEVQTTWLKIFVEILTTFFVGNMFGYK